MSVLTEILKKHANAKSFKRYTESVWRGPERDGVTFSLLSRFLVCRERFRLLVVEGLRPADTFNHRLEYGKMWHICEQALAERFNPKILSRSIELHTSGVITGLLLEYTRELCKLYPFQQEQIEHWYNVCKVQFPIYVEHWAKHPDVKERQPLLQEQVFDVLYKLPSGRTVRLRGKWDSVDLIGRGRAAGIYLQENKTKGNIIEQQIKRQISFDLQVMLYLIALEETTKHPVEAGKRGWIFDKEANQADFNSHRLLGVRYNVVRRPLSGGKGSIVRHKPTKNNSSGESKDEFYNRLASIIKASPEEYFMRWKVEISQQDIIKFRRECLDPILEQLCDWWEWIQGDHRQSSTNSVHWRHPYGVYNVLDEGGSSELDEYLASGSELGLQRTNQLFRELQ